MFLNLFVPQSPYLCNGGNDTYTAGYVKINIHKHMEIYLGAWHKGSQEIPSYTPIDVISELFDMKTHSWL